MTRDEIQEGNRLLAEFMGLRVSLYQNLRGARAIIKEYYDTTWVRMQDCSNQWRPATYHESLDELVLVWEKLKDIDEVSFEYVALAMNGSDSYSFFGYGIDNSEDTREFPAMRSTIKLAAFAATVKAVRELNKEKNE